MGQKKEIHLDFLDVHRYKYPDFFSSQAYMSISPVKDLIRNSKGLQGDTGERERERECLSVERARVGVCWRWGRRWQIKLI